jgi:hypothetical protein
MLRCCATKPAVRELPLEYQQTARFGEILSKLMRTCDKDL